MAGVNLEGNMEASGKPAEEKWMRQALTLARKAAGRGEVPVGALVVQAGSGKIWSRAHNTTESRFDPTGHAEIAALRRAAKKLGRWRLSDCTLVVTLEPCAMCAGAAVWARIGRIVYGAADSKAGACGSVLQVASHRQLNHRVEVRGGILEAECGRVLSDFFRQRRMAKKARI
jgi:tRNA(adenine34) deaminase